jgi:tetratricopeptide (TPR) repeat protein
VGATVSPKPQPSGAALGAAAGPPARTVARWWPALLAAAALATYATSLRNGFCWDDQFIVVENTQALTLASPGEILLAPDVLHRGQPTPYYRPLTRLSLVIDRHLHGLDPLPYHVENAALHALAVVLLFALGFRLGGSAWSASVAALLFAVHPVGAEVVNLAAHRNNLLSVVFVLGAALAWMRGRSPLRPAWIAAAAILFFLGLASKETALMLLPLLAARELFPLAGLRARVRGAATALAPFAAAVLGYVVLRSRAITGPSGVSITLEPIEGLSRSLHLIPKYLALLAWPSGLTVHHGPPERFLASGALLAVVWGAIVALLVGAIRTRRPLTSFGLLWAAMNFVPVSTLVPIPSAPFAERFAYLPAIGLWLVVADQLERLRETRPSLRRPLTAAVLAIALALAARTASRNLDWRDNVALFTSAARVVPDSIEAANNLGLALQAAGDEGGARREWERAIAIDPTNAGALVLLAELDARAGDLPRARARLERAVAASPGDAEARFDLALAAEQLGDLREALRQYEAFLALAPVDHAELIPRVQQRVEALRARLGAAH